MIGAIAMVLLVADRPPSPYLLEAQVPDLVYILPLPPTANDPRRADDRATFAQTRALLGSERWHLATRDVTDDRFTVFACATGMRLDAASAPALTKVFARMSDGGMASRAKAAFAVRRPYLDQPGAICEPKIAHLAANGDYPLPWWPLAEHVGRVNFDSRRKGSSRHPDRFKAGMLRQF